MTRHGMMLSALSEQVLREFRNIFYEQTGQTKEDGPTLYPLDKIVTYEKRGWTFDQRLGRGFKMVFRHYGLKSDKEEYGKYDHVIYVDVEKERKRDMDPAAKKSYSVQRKVAAKVTREIEAYLTKNGLAIEIQMTDGESPRQKPEAPLATGP